MTSSLKTTVDPNIVPLIEIAPRNPPDTSTAAPARWSATEAVAPAPRTPPGPTRSRASDRERQRRLATRSTSQSVGRQVCDDATATVPQLVRKESEISDRAGECARGEAKAAPCFCTKVALRNRTAGPVAGQDYPPEWRSAQPPRRRAQPPAPRTDACNRERRPLPTRPATARPHPPGRHGS